MRKPWMKCLKSYRFNREGTMTQETQSAQRECNKRQTPSARMCEAVIGEYAKALGVSANEACVRVNRQHSLMES